MTMKRIWWSTQDTFSLALNTSYSTRDNLMATTAQLPRDMVKKMTLARTKRIRTHTRCSTLNTS